VRRPVTDRHALRTLNRLWALSKYDRENVARTIAPHIKPERIVLMAKFLNSLVGSMLKEKTDSKCADCGKSMLARVDAQKGVAHILSHRLDARYCSAKCRQAAYRKRVTVRSGKARTEPSRVTAHPDGPSTPARRRRHLPIERA
jgi:hypothetical protein